MLEQATKQQIEVVQMPTTSDINALRIKRFKQQITDVCETHDLTEFSQLLAAYAEETGKPFDIIAAALANIGQQGRPFLAKDRPKREQRQRRDGKSRRQFEREESVESSGRRNHGANRRPRKMGPPASGMTRFRIDVGRADGVQPRNIVGAVANEAGIEGSHIGPIQIYDSYTILDLPKEMPGDVYQSLSRTRILGKPLRLTLASKADEGKSSGPKGHFKDKRTGKSRKKSSGGKRVSAGKPEKNRKLKSIGKRKKSNSPAIHTVV